MEENSQLQDLFRQHTGLVRARKPYEAEDSGLLPGEWIRRSSGQWKNHVTVNSDLVGRYGNTPELQEMNPEILLEGVYL